jgi:hypothetical protein
VSSFVVTTVDNICRVVLTNAETKFLCNVALLFRLAEMYSQVFLK